MRRTEKFNKGWEMAFELGLSLPKKIDNNLLYMTLEQKGYWWSGKNRRWEKESEKPSTSIFADKAGNPTGIAHFRVMCHPEDTAFFVQALENCPDLTVTDVSAESYPNRNGAGERTYVTVVRKG